MLVLKQWWLARNALIQKKPAVCRLFCFRRHNAQLSIVALLLLLCATYHPAQALTISDARHLLARTGFDPTWQEISPLLPLSREQAVVRIVTQASTKPIHPIDNALLTAPEVSHETMMLRSPSERQAAQKLERQRLESLQSWWVQQMVETKTPLAEQMMLFWHNHFTSSIQKVRTARLMALQHNTQRRFALDNFANLLNAMIHDPAMLRYLDAANNRKEQPNENFARELLELFSLGIGNYREQDIKEASRAFSGWTVNRENACFQFNAKEHDNGIKNFLGKTGNFNGDDIIRIVLDQPATSRFIITKLWRQFISDTPDLATVNMLAIRWQHNHHYDIKLLLIDLFNTDAFWDQRNHGVLVKSPTDYIVSLLRVWKSPNEQSPQWRNQISLLGQDLFNPPNVKGWEGGNSWINTNTFVARQQLIRHFLYDPNGMRSKKLPETWNSATQQLWQMVLLALPPNNYPDGRPIQQIEAWLLDPIFQLK